MKVKVFGVEYDVVETEHIQEFGRIEHGSLTIYIRKGLSPPVFEMTLWHELVHAIEYATGMDIGEQNVDCIASGIYSILVDNGWKSPLSPKATRKP